VRLALLTTLLALGLAAPAPASYIVAPAPGAPTGGAAAPATGELRAAVLLVNFDNARSQPWAAAQVDAALDSVDALYQRQSDGEVSLSADVHGWYELSYDASACDLWQMASRAEAAATAAGVALGAYDHVLYAYPSIPACGFAGAATMPGDQVWINGYATSRRVLAHELGHNLGVNHASTLRCTEGGVRVATSASCSLDEYGDPFDFMGSSNTMTSAWHRADLGYDATETRKVTADEPGDYALHSVNGAPGGARVLLIPRTTSTRYAVELRSPVPSFDDFAAGAPISTGVTIRVVGPTRARQNTQLVDTHPVTATFSDAPLAVGETFTDAARELGVELVALDGGVATVRIHDGEAPPAPAPQTVAPPPPPPPAPTTPEPEPESDSEERPPVVTPPVAEPERKPRAKRKTRRAKRRARRIERKRRARLRRARLRARG
jgi:Gametolysin peptidase M11